MPLRSDTMIYLMFTELLNNFNHEYVKLKLILHLAIITTMPLF